MLNKFGVVCVVIALFGIAIVVGFAVAPSQSSVISITTFSDGTQTTSQTDPYLMSCDQLHNLILQYQQKVESDNPYAPTPGVNVNDAALLNYYTQVYNLRISEVGTAIASGCSYPTG